MTVVMTGGAGFLGLHLVSRQLMAGRHVTILAHGDAAATRRRVDQFLDLTGASGQRLEVLTADIEHPTLGLSPRPHRQLAATTEELWHVAASVVLHRHDEQVWQTNVTGTENLLRFAAATAPAAPLYHVSTAFVAGKATGRVHEASSDSVATFENTYERSKHTAEAAVRQWARQQDRRALVLRPSILVPPAASTGVAARRHTLGTFLDILATLRERHPPGSASRLVLRVGADPRAHLNLLPVDWAAATMLRVAASGAGTTAAPAVHIVHPHDVAVRSISAAVEDLCQVRLRMVPAAPAQPTDAEQAFYRKAAGFLPYMYHRRDFDDSTLRRLVPDLPPLPDIDRAYVRECLSQDEALVGVSVA